MLDEQRIFEYGNLLAAGYGLYQAKSIHDTELERAKQRHHEAIELAKAQHENDMKTVKQTYLLELFNSLEQHFQQLNADLIASSRESERDMFDQRNQSFQTIILASSVMFSALASIIVDGNLPTNSGSFLLIGYSLTCSLSFSFLFLSIVFCIELVIRTSSFMYKRGKSHTKSLRRAINDTKGMMKDLRGEGKNSGSLKDSSDANLAEKGNADDPDSLKESTKDVPSSPKFNTDSSKGSDESANVKGFRRAISRMKPNEIEKEFERHEHEIRGYLKKRELLNDSAALTSYKDVVTGHMKPFKHFWEESCETWWSLAILLFYGGSLNMLLALMIYMWAQFFIHYDSLIAAVIGVSVLGLISIIGIGTVIVMRHVDRSTHLTEMAELRAASVMIPDEGSRKDYSGSTAEEFESERSAGLRSRWGGAAFGGRGRVDRSDSNGSLLGAPPPPPPPPLPPSSRPHAASPSADTHILSAWQATSNGSTGTAEVTPPPSVSSDRSTRGGGAFRSQAQAPHLYPHQTPTHSSRPPTGRYSAQAGTAEHSFPHRLATHIEDVETGTVRSDSSGAHSALGAPPPRLRSGGSPRSEHIFQEEPSPRRRFLSSFGRSASGSTPAHTGQKTPSLYETSQCRTPGDARGTPLVPSGASAVNTPVVGASRPGPNQQSGSRSAPRVPQNTPNPAGDLEGSHDSSSDLSGSGGITF